MLKDQMMPNAPEQPSWRKRPMRETNIEIKGNVKTIESERGYPWREQLDRRDGKFLELAGPTKYYPADILDFSKYRENTICSNLTLREGINVVADATEAPFRDGEFRAVFISAFRIRDEKRIFDMRGHKGDAENVEEVAKVAKEAWRVLAPGGLLVWQKIETKEELQSIEALGFVPVYSKESIHSARGGQHRYQMVYLKEAG